jgi:hypothetical protein
MTHAHFGTGIKYAHATAVPPKRPAT